MAANKMGSMLVISQSHTTSMMSLGRPGAMGRKVRKPFFKIIFSRLKTFCIYYYIPCVFITINYFQYS